MELHQALSPMYYFSKLFAQMSYKFDTETNTYCTDYLAIVYGLSVAFGTAYLLLTRGKDELRMIEEKDQNSISEMSNVLDLYLSLGNQTIIIILNCMYVQKLSQLLTNLGRIDKQINQLIMTPINNHKLFVMCSWGIVIILFEFNATFWPDITFFFGQEVISYLISTYLPIIIVGVFKLQFFMYVYIITDRMRLLCTFLKQMECKFDHTPVFHVHDISKHTENHSFDGQHFVDAIENVHIIHQNLCNAYEEVNTIYSFQLLLNVISAFGENLTDLYYCYLLISEYQSATYTNWVLDLYFTIQWCFMQITELIVIAIICHKAHVQMFKMKTSIHSLLNKVSNEQIKSSLKIFALHEMHRNFRFTAAGLFTMDFTMIQMVCGLITTYLIITVQLDMGKYNNQQNSTTTYT